MPGDLHIKRLELIVASQAHTTTTFVSCVTPKKLLNLDKKFSHCAYASKNAYFQQLISSCLKHDTLQAYTYNGRLIGSCIFHLVAMLMTLNELERL